VIVLKFAGAIAVIAVFVYLKWRQLSAVEARRERKAGVRSLFSGEK
jgi:hypothetical protein